MVSTLDLASGYWQIEICPEDRQKTAFVIPSGLHELETIPFGLSNAPPTFQKLMQVVLQQCNSKQCLVYLDVIIVFGGTIEEHNTDLRCVLEKLHQAGLQLRTAKYKFLHTELKFLGHKVTLFEKIIHWPTPKNVKDVRSFVGLATYYRRFIRNFATIAGPLHRLTEKGHKFLWTTECDQAFMKLKEELTSPPILSLPDLSPEALAFIINTDASKTAIEAVFSQKSPDGKEKVIAYASRTLDKR